MYKFIKTISETYNIKDTELLILWKKIDVYDIMLNTGKDFIQNQNFDVYTQQGSISYLLFGKQPSVQSINIKFGKLGEIMFKQCILLNPRLKLLECGVHKIGSSNIDIDLLWKKDNTIYYREIKANINLDTEKVKGTSEKCDTVKAYLLRKYPKNDINVGILCWGCYSRNSSNMQSKIQTFENKYKINVYFVDIFLYEIDTVLSENDYYKCFRELGSLIPTY